MQVPKKKLKGKRRLLRQFKPDVSDTNIAYIQKRMKRANNCKATSWKCSSCSIPTLAKCYAKMEYDLQMEAMKKYKDRKEYKKEQEKINREKLYIKKGMI